ncbi:hypothetical protein CFC21_107923 [Triticum aestivum]|uniref:TRF2/HOY1 PH-like domain-containing protein n=2 Tax=Triticum aestivum TaxID=4565 RepID=A0A3B6TF26_WHEAT|nr:uncharacterized protein LOC109753329 [Aegilops tauschii subsp. strangulata]XP_044437895.1 uncharacterized protein LOC123164453 [Triticum aestivum]KAF7107276.1 hypothetical protein CFC21_107923 [Triticum aestivum]
MVQLPAMGKRQHPEPAEPPMAPPAAAVKMEADELRDFDHGPLGKRARPGQPSPPPLTPPHQDMYHNVLDEPSPLGLRLKKSPSLLDLIQMRLSQANSDAGQSTTDNAEPSKKKDLKSGTSSASERLKASNFPASVLKIGTWKYTSKYEGDLVAKCYFAKHKLVWEVLEGGLKSKIEIQWSDITALKVTLPEVGDGSLDVMLARPPLFFKETDPQPRKHTLWQATSDFTRGQASMNRHHFLQCPTTSLGKNFEKLVQCDQRLHQLSQQTDVILDSSVFEPRCSIFEDPVELKCHDFANLKDEREDLPGFSGSVSPCAGSSMSTRNDTNDCFGKQPEFVAQPMHPGASAVNAQPVSRNVNGVAQEFNIPNWWSQLKVPGLRPSMSVDDLVSHLGNCISEQITSGNPSMANNEVPTKESLEEIAQYLLGDAQGPQAPASDERLMARVDSLCCLLQKDTAPVSQPKPEPNDSGSIGGVDSEGSDDEFSSASTRKTADANQQPPAMSRKDSFGDLLMNLPRIASIPQFLFKIPEDSEN